jgi:23S rRNA pseudouridine1911/1915/1917 synthase
MTLVVVPARAEGHRLDVALAELIPGASRRGARAAIAKGDLRLSGSVCRIASRPVLAGDRIDWLGGPEVDDAEDVPVLDETKDWLLLSKPAGMLTEPAARTGIAESLGTALEIARRRLVLSRGPRTFVGAVGRLDRPVSGALLLATAPPIHGKLVEALRGPEARKVYLALCERAPAEPSGTVDFPVARRNAWTFMAVRPDEPRPADAKDARSVYRTLSTTERGALVAIRLLTGRTHQARIHLAAAGAPIAGDTIYGEAAPAGTPPERVFLHAAALRFRWKNGLSVLTAPPSDDWLAEAERRGLRLPEGWIDGALELGGGVPGSD